MEPSEVTGDSEAGIPSGEAGPIDSDPQEHPQPQEDNAAMEEITPVGGNDHPKDNEQLEEKTSLDNPEQQEAAVPSTEITHNENIGPSSPPPRESSMRSSKDGRQDAATNKNLSEFDGKPGAYAYKPGTSTLVFRHKKPGESPGETLLKAVSYGQTKAVELLLAAGASTEFKDSDDRTPLLHAVQDNKGVIVDLLLEKKADWNARDKSGRTALHIAASFKHSINVLCRLLNTPEIDVDAQDEQCETPLHIAARNGNPSTVALLLDSGANVNAKDKRGFTPLHLAAARRVPVLVEMMLSAKDVQVDVRANNGRTPLMQACNQMASQECEEIVKLLLDAGADPAARDHNGETPVYLSAVAENRPNLVTLISWKKRPIDINALTEDNQSALFGPARFGFAGSARLLLDAGIDSTVRDKNGRTAFLESAKYDHIEVMRLILENLVTKHGQDRKTLIQPALFEAAVQDSSQIARFLIEQGASMDEKDPLTQKTTMEIANDHGSQKVIAVLLEKGDQLISQGPSSSGVPLKEALPEAEPMQLVLKDSVVDLTFGFQSTIASFPYDTRKNYRIKRPQLRSLLYDQNPEPIQYGLKEADSTSKNFRWLHVPSNNIVWVNKLISRMYKECHPPEKVKYFQEKCKHLFGEEIWTRHQYQMSSTSVAHRRFIRPICQRVSMSETDDNMMMVLPYIHWETKGGRKQMTDVIVEAMKRHINDPQPPSTLKGLNEALEELEKIRNPKKDIDADDDASSGYSSYYSSYYDSYASSASSDRRTRASRKTKPSADPDVDLISRMVTDTLENEFVRRTGRAPVEKKVEQEERRKKRIQKIIKVAKESRTPDEKLILAYMFDEIPLHFRRTLDQYYYYTLPTTEARDIDQVVSRYFEKTWPEEENENLVLMVDQLWLWILDKDTVVTSFPQRWNKSETRSEKDPDPNNDSDIVESIIRQIGKKDRRPLTDVFDLAELIVSKCVGTMFEHPDIANEKLRFAEFFEISIGNVTNEESKMFNEFTDLSKRLAKDDQNILNSDELKEDLKKLFDISEETKFVKEIKDIRDELHIISTVLDDQEKVLVDMEEAIQAMKASKTEGEEPKKLHTTPKAHSLPESIRMHKNVVQGLDKQAEKTYVALKDLLDLKQKQANVSEARTQGKQAADTARQGQIIMLFTIITVFFLPLSFMSSFLDLDIAEFARNGDGELGLGYVSKVMFTVTIGVCAISFFFAFGWQLFLAFVEYFKNLLISLHQGLKEFFGFFSNIFTQRSPTFVEEEVVVVRRRIRSPQRHTWFGEERERSISRSRRWSRSDSDEVIVIEGRSSTRDRTRSRAYRRRRSRYSPSPRRSMSTTKWLGVIPPLFGLLGLGQGTKTKIVEERYSRRRSTSPVWRWYGDDERHYSQKRKKWPPWAWFEKSPAPYQRRRGISYRDERRSTSPKGFYGTFIMPLLGLFGKSQRGSARRTSFTSSYFSDYYGSGSSRATRRSNESSEARSRRSRRS